jgi:hypothetical protein
MSSAKLRIPSASFSVAIASALSCHLRGREIERVRKMGGDERVEVSARKVSGILMDLWKPERRLIDIDLLPFVQF